MFRDWGFLLGEIWVLLALAALIGLLAGWLIWGRREAAVDTSAQLQADLDRCRSMHADKDDRIRALEAEIDALRSVQSAPVAVPAPEPVSTDFDGDGVEEGTDEGIKPATLAAARDGGADDLKKIKGVGPKLEALCNRLGFYHFDQIAQWGAAEIAWVDSRLKFKGRIERDDWVAQASELAKAGG